MKWKKIIKRKDMSNKVKAFKIKKEMNVDME